MSSELRARRLSTGEPAGSKLEAQSSKLIWDAGATVVSELRTAGHQAWLVGGCVRDRLLSRPLKDADVATSAEPDEVERLFPRTVAVGKTFGVIKVVVPGAADSTAPITVEVASLRADDRYIDGRRPVAIRRGSLQEDAERRDLTINALYADPNGDITDPVNGLADLHGRILRGIGDPAARLAEDRLRVLRVLRFAAVLDFAIEARTAAAVTGTTITGVSRERVLDELGKACIAGAGGGFLRACAGHGHLAAVAPCADPGLAAVLLDRIGPAGLELALAAWLLPNPVDATNAWISMQPVSGTVRRVVPWLIATAPRLKGLPVAERRRALRRPEGALCAFFAAAIDPDFSSTYAQWEAWDADPRPCPVSAADLISLGCPAGPELGRRLRLIEDAWLSGTAADRDTLLALAGAIS
jgi:poly(A) polymerase